MIRHTPQFSFDELLDFIALEESEPSYDALVRWCTLYPDFTEKLAEYFMTWAEQVEQPIARSLDSDRFASLAVSHALNILHRERAEAHTNTPEPVLQTLSQAARNSGLSDAELAAKTGLDESMIVKLDRRRIFFETIPFLCLERLSQALRQTFEQIEAHLRGPPLAVSAGGRFKSKQKPVPKQETFAQALESSDLEETQRLEWKRVLEQQE